MARRVFVRTRGGISLPAPSGGSDPHAFRDPTGADLYVDFTAGSDGSGTLASPYNTLTEARVKSVAAGQAMWFRNGTGVWPDCTNTQDGSGDSISQRITFSSYPGETCTLQPPTDGTSQGGGWYWDFRRFQITCPNTGIRLSNPDESNPASFVRFIDCNGTRTSGSITDNSAIIYSYTSEGVMVIRGTYTGPSGLSNNQTLLFFNSPTNCLIIGVLLDQCAIPIYFKHANTFSAGSPAGVVKNCIIRRAGRGFQAAANYATYQNNVFDATPLDLSESGGGTFAGGNNCTVSHCTFFGSSAGVGMIITDSGTRLRENNVLANNVFSGSGVMYYDNPYNANSGYDQNNSIDYSAVNGSGVSYYQRNSTTYTMSGYNSAWGDEAHGEAGTVSFVGGGSGGGNTPANWALAGGSIGRANGSDGADRGVDASKLLTVN